MFIIKIAKSDINLYLKLGLLVINFILQWYLGFKIMFDKLEKYMNKYGYLLNKKKDNLK